MSQPNKNSQLLALFHQLSAEAKRANHRRLMVLAGEAEWAQGAAQAMASSTMDESWLWVASDAASSQQSVSSGQARKVLGQEFDVVVYNAHQGLDPDALGAVCGTIRGGGLLLLLTPPLQQWPTFNDPDYARLLVANYSLEEINGYFLKRLVDVIKGDAHAIVCEQGRPLPKIETASVALSVVAEVPFASEDQKAAVEKIKKVVTGHRRRPAVLISDRGRGKSAALGIAAAQLILEKRVQHVLVTAPSVDAIESLYAHALSQLPGAVRGPHGLECDNSRIQFIAPDALLENPIAADLLLVDEAAAIPVQLLESFLQHHSRIVFATTVHGYEGTGRGFTTRFQKQLDKVTPGWSSLRMEQPIRWTVNDPLEQWLFNALCLDAEPVGDALIAAALPEQCVTVEVSREQLLQDKTLLQSLFGLLVIAHYRTTPSDLRNLLDGPNLSIYVMRYQGHVVGTALVAKEGEFDADLAKEICKGKRRPRGHLLSQSIATFLNSEEAARLRCGRIMRIAIHPSLQQKGFGSALINHVTQQLQQQRYDLIGASFGATVELLNFWHQQQMKLLKVGFTREHTSGAYSVIVARPLSEQGEICYAEARKQVSKQLPYQLAEPLQDLDIAVALSLLKESQQVELVMLDEQDKNYLQAYAKGERGYELTLQPIWHVAHQALIKPTAKLTMQQKIILLLKVQQCHSWSQVVKLMGLSGRREAKLLLRESVMALL